MTFTKSRAEALAWRLRAIPGVTNVRVVRVVPAIWYNVLADFHTLEAVKRAAAIRGYGCPVIDGSCNE